METRIDGRSARRERTRQAIVDAHTEMLREGTLKPTAQAVADRAGVSVRTLWSIFADLESLFRETVKRWSALDDEAWEPVDPAGPLVERIESFCARRVRRIENLAPAARSAVLSEPFSQELRDSRAFHVDRLMGDLEHTFGPELGRRDGPNAAVYHALFIQACWPTWETLTQDLGLEPAEARQLMADGFRRILAD